MPTDDECEKVLYCIRHGESFYNEWRKRSLRNFSWIFVRDPMIIDAALTEKGELQAEALHQHMREEQLDTKIEIILCSPLTRAIQTALRVFQNSDIPILIAPLCREELGSACDIGRSSEELNKQFAEHLNRIDFSSLSAFWWTSATDPTEHAIPSTVKQVQQMKESSACSSARITAFKAQLSALPHRHIAIVGHSGYFRKMLHMRRKLNNCELYIVPFQKIAE